MNHSNNTQHESLYDESCGFLHPSVITKTGLVAAYITLFLAACLENAFVIYLARTCKELKRSTFNILIFNMAVADVLDVAFSTALSLWWAFVNLQWIPGLLGKISCKLVHFLFVLSIHLHTRYNVWRSIPGNRTYRKKVNDAIIHNKIHRCKLGYFIYPSCYLSL